MRPPKAFPEGTSERLQVLLKQSKKSDERARIQAVLMRAAFSSTPAQIAAITGLSVNSVRILQRCNTESMSRFLLGLAEAYPDRRIVLFLDGAGWHHSKALPVPERMRLELLPAYTPETNPAEHLWDELREKCTANRLFATLDAVEESIKTGLDELAADAVRLAKITRFSWIQNLLLYF